MAKKNTRHKKNNYLIIRDLKLINMQKDRYSCNPFREFKLESMCTLEQYYRIFFQSTHAKFRCNSEHVFTRETRGNNVQMRVTHAASF